LAIYTENKERIYVKFISNINKKGFTIGEAFKEVIYDTMNEFTTWSFWISAIGTLLGIVSLVITFITWKNTTDIKTNMYKQRLKKQAIAELKSKIGDIEGRIGYINKEKIIDRNSFVSEFFAIIELLSDLSVIFTRKQKNKLEKLRKTYNSLVNSRSISPVVQLEFLTSLKQFCNQIVTYYKENDNE
jgi:hypothetical protein